MDRRIIQILQSNGLPMKPVEIGKLCGVANKSDLNHLLYGMKARGLLNKEQDVPPLWTVAVGESAGTGPPVKTSKQQLSARNHHDLNGALPNKHLQTRSFTEYRTPPKPYSDSDDSGSEGNNVSHTSAPRTEQPDYETASTTHQVSELETKVLKHLSSCKGNSNHTLLIAKAIGLRTKSDVNRALYALAKKGLILQCCDNSKITWALAEAGIKLTAATSTQCEGGTLEAQVQLRPACESTHQSLQPSFDARSQPPYIPGRQPGSYPRPDTEAAFTPTNQGAWSDGTTYSPAAAPASTGNTFTAAQAAASWNLCHVAQAEPPPLPSLMLQTDDRYNILLGNIPSSQRSVAQNMPSIWSSTGLEACMSSEPVTGVSMCSPSDHNSGSHISATVAAATLSLPRVNSLDVLTSATFAALNKNPISALTEYGQARRVAVALDVVRSWGQPHCPSFEVAAKVDGRQFPSVTAKTKKDGRRMAADLAMRALMAEGLYQPKGPVDASIIQQLEQGTWADRVAAQCHSTFTHLTAEIQESLAGRKVLAAIVMKRELTDQGTVVAMGTGNRCITGERMSLEGQVVNDSHAEVIARRSLVRFLYKQLDLYARDPAHSILQPSIAGDLLKVKDGLCFHLYISTAPCGDGAIFSISDKEDNYMNDENTQEHRPKFSSKAGQLRTKMENGEGTIPIEANFTHQTWDGIVRGERLRTMSCSDKIARWNVLGLQGALLSNFLEPIYLHSITLGYLYNHGQLARAVCCRISQPQVELQPPYKVNHPWLGRISKADALRETEKTKQTSLNWCSDDDRVEVTDGSTGQCTLSRALDETSISRVAKCKLYEKFKETSNLFHRMDLLGAECYYKAKQTATLYQQAKAQLFKLFLNRGMGTWICKPMEEKLF
ncbi:PREDICTED: double-stranded RNA-specific adenosine deaminase-like [Priapulus caudatus]|uniref:Double-stranded RNA-specific adenosine deaminase-like n=1 Tax=Priapulus caudatus TaxID=37621 RepID=A0ABM1DV47_PRICU|nr:PREDICTED: double-stranded RNA-specific adenosine deaminase-like [Priapulus caudatus]